MSTRSADPVEVLHGTQVTLRKVTEADVEPLAKILAEPEEIPARAVCWNA